MKYKSEAPTVLRNLIESSDRSVHSLKVVRFLTSDHGGKFTSNNFESYLQQKGIQHKTGPARTPNYNDQERHNQTLNNKQRALLKDAGLPDVFWTFAREVAQHVKNLTPTFALENAITPFEAFYGRKPDLTTIRAFGCPVYAHLDRTERGRHEDTSVRGIFLGYQVPRRSYYVLTDANKIEVTRDVTFHEDLYVNDIVQRAQQHWKTLQKSINSGGESTSDSESDDEVYYWPPSMQNATQPLSATPEPKQPSSPPHLEKKQSAKSVQLEQQKKQDKIQRLMKDLSIDMNYMSAETDFMFTMMSVGLAPRTYKEVMEHPDKEEWLKAIDIEQQALSDLKCFGPPQDLPQGFKATTTSYLFVIKPDGTKKARLVFRYTPSNGIFGSDETYSPVIDKSVLRMFLTEAMSRGMVVEQADCKNAYVNAKMEDEEYVKMPKGFFNENGKVRRLYAALYGHPKSGKLWYKLLIKFLTDMGFKRSQRDSCFFFTLGGEYLLIIYVDDILVGADNTGLMDDFFGKLESRFNVKRMGFPANFTGTEIVQLTPNLVVMHQN